MTVWLCQYKCANNHCMVAGGFEESKLSVAEAELDTLAGWEKMVASGVPAICRICGSKSFHFDTRPTRFKTMAEALPFLKRSEADNVRSGDLWEALAEFATQERDARR